MLLTPQGSGRFSQTTRTDKEEDRAYLDDPLQPQLQGKIPRLSESRRVEGVRYFPPAFPLNGAPTQILAIGIAPTPEEAASILATQHAEHFQKPRLLKGPLGQILKDIIDRFPVLQSDNLTYATAIPWLLPKSRRFRPNKDELLFCKSYLQDLVNHTQPAVIVAFGKPVFDQLIDLKISADDARGGWFDYKGIPVYLMEPIHQLVTQPWTLDIAITDFKEVARMVDLRKGIGEQEQPLRMREIRTIEQLEELVKEWEEGNYTLFAVDNEWKGANFVDGQLRSTQFAWTPYDSAYLNFFNERGEPILGRTEQVTPIGVTGEKALVTFQATGQPGEPNRNGDSVDPSCLFRVGDKVTAFGHKGTVENYTQTSPADNPLILEESVEVHLVEPIGSTEKKDLATNSEKFNSGPAVPIGPTQALQKIIKGTVWEPLLADGPNGPIRGRRASDMLIDDDKFFGVVPIGDTEKKDLAANSEKFNSGPAVPIGTTPAGTPAQPGEFYVDYKKVGEILGRWLNRPEIRYIGHYYAADSPWMEHWLNLKVLGRCAADTAFMMQTINEYVPHGLERLALQVTNFGRYDMPLVMAKKELKISKGEGYARIPDEILVGDGGLASNAWSPGSTHPTGAGLRTQRLRDWG